MNVQQQKQRTMFPSKSINHIVARRRSAPAYFRRAFTLQCYIGLLCRRVPTRSTTTVALSYSSSSQAPQSQLQQSNKRRTATFPVFFDSSNDLHRDLQYHPEQPARISACVKAIEEEIRQKHEDELSKRHRTIDLVDVAPRRTGVDGDDTELGTVTGPTTVLRHEPFADAELEHAKSMLFCAHDDVLVAQMEHRCRTAKQKRKEDGKPPLGHIGYIDFDTCTYVYTRRTQSAIVMDNPSLIC